MSCGVCDGLGHTCDGCAQAMLGLIRNQRLRMAELDEVINIACEEKRQQEQRIARLESALRQIVFHADCTWPIPQPLYTTKEAERIGRARGHRCAAEIAREALKEAQ